MQDARDHNPDTRADQVLCEAVSVVMSVSPGEAEREVSLQELVADVDEQRVHTDLEKWSAVPPMHHVDDNVQHGKNTVRHSAYEKDEARCPQVLVDRNAASRTEKAQESADKRRDGPAPE